MNWIRGWVDPRTDMDDVEKRKLLTLPGLELQPLGRPGRSQSLYPVRYPGSFGDKVLFGNRRMNTTLNLCIHSIYAKRQVNRKVKLRKEVLSRSLYKSRSIVPKHSNHYRTQCNRFIFQ
jgi:hypothetical protein